jgi:CHAD domain-containing protein
MREFARLQSAMLLRRLAFQVSRTARSGKDPDAVHDLRVSIRRLSRCLRVFAEFYPGGSWKKKRRELARLMQMAGRVRDRDVALALLAEAGAERGGAIASRLEAERQQAARDLQLETQRWKRSGFSRRWRTALEL